MDAKHEAVAAALFRAIYSNVDDDPTFPDRVWAQMSEEQRRRYYRQADVALAAAAAV